MLSRSVNDAHEERPGVHIYNCRQCTDSRFEQFGSSRTMFALIASVAYNMSLFYAILYRVAASLLTGLHFCTYIFSVITMSLFGLQVCSGTYQKITNTNAAANKPPMYKNRPQLVFIM